MQAFEEATCPVCKAKLFTDDDIAVCPVCGAHHHRSCYHSLGVCAHEKEHGSFIWEPPEPSSQSSTAQTTTPPPGFQPTQNDRVGHVCPQCKRPSTSGVLFCPYCGYSFYGGENGKPQNENQTPFPPFPEGFPFVRPVVFDPYGGVSPSETVDEVQVPELAKFVLVNTRRYVPRFYRTAQTGKKTGWNWSAFFFPNLWFLFRKCYKEGLLFTIISLISNVLCFPFTLKWNEFLAQAAQESAGAMPSSDTMVWALRSAWSNSSLLALISVCTGIVLFVLFRILASLFGDYIYGKQAIGTVKTIHRDFEGEEAEEMIRIKGGVNLLFPVIAFTAVNFAPYFIQQFF